jgi:hypothetical protein
MPTWTYVTSLSLWAVIPYPDGIGRAVAMNLMDDTDESSIRTLQNYGNLVHAGRILRTGTFRDPIEDARIVRSHLIRFFRRHGAINE